MGARGRFELTPSRVYSFFLAAVFGDGHSTTKPYDYRQASKTSVISSRPDQIGPDETYRMKAVVRGCDRGCPCLCVCGIRLQVSINCWVLESETQTGFEVRDMASFK